MRQVDRVIATVEDRSENTAHARRGAALLGLGFACPPRVWTQDELTEAMIDLWRLAPPAAERFRRIAAGTMIESRRTVLPIDEVAGLSTRTRMSLYETHAPPLAAAASVDALVSAGITGEQVTDVVVVSCTGFSAPGLDVALVERLGLRPTVRRTSIGFMGCYGAIVGLRTAASIATADPDAVVLVVCLELCSLHLRPDRGVQNQVASALFGDGAAAAVIGGAPVGGGATFGLIGASRSLLIEEGRDWMSWRITNAGFAMTLSREVPVALRACIREFVASFDEPSPMTHVVHPGGPEILRAVEEGLDLANDPGLAAARRVLRDYGNMSSTTVLFVLDEALRAGAQRPALLMAFGPGLAVEGIRVGDVVG